MFTHNTVKLNELIFPKSKINQFDYCTYTLTFQSLSSSIRYAVIDIETTGLSPTTEKITEVAVYIFENNKVIDEYATLVNPQKLIPYHITKVTGIDDSMVYNAPTFPQVAKKIVEITQGCIFTAHNAKFDYGFIQAEFASLGYQYEREQLCTVKLSKQLIKGLPSYKLGNLCSHLGISLNNAHRAAADAKATVHLLYKLLEIQANQPPEVPKIKKSTTPRLNPELLSQIPESCGVYYFYDKKAEPIYVGKSIHLKTRVLDHLKNPPPGKDKKMATFTTQIKWKETGSELIALLLESHEIKNLQPKYNRSQKQLKLSWGLFSKQNEAGYNCFFIDKVSTQNEEPHLFFKNKEAAKNYLHDRTTKNNLCQSLNGLYAPSDFSCMLHQMNMCHGACQGLEPVKDYNTRTKVIIEQNVFSIPNFAIIDKGRKNDEKSVILIKDGNYVGWNYLKSETIQPDIKKIENEIIAFEDNQDVRKIIQLHLEKHSDVLEIIEL